MSTIPPVAKRSTGLDDWQNACVRKAIVELLPRYESQKELAGDIGISGAQVSRILNGGGTQYSVAERVAQLKGIAVWELFGGGAGKAATLRWRDVPGFDAALRTAQNMVSYPSEVWEMVAEISAPVLPARVEPMHLVRTADYVSATLRESMVVRR